MDFGILPADVLRLVQQHLNWTTACALTLTCTYWYKSLRECLLHPTITMQSNVNGKNQTIVIHKGRFLQFGIRDNMLVWNESTFGKASSIQVFVAYIQDILCNRLPIQKEDPKPKSAGGKRVIKRHYMAGSLEIVLPEGPIHWIVDSEYRKPDQQTLPEDLFATIYDYLDKMIQESLPAINTSIGHCIKVAQCLGGHKSTLELDDDGNLRWSRFGRLIQTKYSLAVYNKLKEILLSDKKHTLSLTEKPTTPKDKYTSDQILSFEAEYLIDEKTSKESTHIILILIIVSEYNLEKFIKVDGKTHVREEFSVHRDKVLKLFIKELSALYDEKECMYSKHFFARAKCGEKSPAPWLITAFEPKLNVTPLKANKLVPFQRVTLSSNHAKRARRSTYKYRYLDVTVTSDGDCYIRRMDQPTVTERLDYNMTREFMSDLFGYVVKKNPKHSNVLIEPYGPITNINVDISFKIYLSIEGIKFCWQWILKNILTEPYPAIIKPTTAPEANK